MLQLDPIIAVSDVNISAKWDQQVFGFRRKHGGDEFADLVKAKDKIVLCLHKWGPHEHPTMIKPRLFSLSTYWHQRFLAQKPEGLT